MDPRGIISYGTTNNCGVCVPVTPFREINYGSPLEAVLPADRGGCFFIGKITGDLL